MRIAITGKAGQVVSSLLERGRAAGHELIAVGRPELDLTDRASVAKALGSVEPEAVISAAAYTAVDKAESERDLAFAVNEGGALAVAEASRTLGVPLIHISTDYVFDGSLDRPYVESDSTGPTGVYGASKLAGEEAVRSVLGDSATVLRVAWVYSPFGTNFVKTMLRLAAGRDEISVVADQFGNPTNALDIADGILKVAANLIGDANPALRGIFHMTARGEASWADFAQAIFEASATAGGTAASVNRITTADYPTPAQRPANSRLNSSLIARSHGVTLPHWREALEPVVARLQPAAPRSLT